MEELIKLAAHTLGVVGMAGVWLIPAHAWALVDRGGASDQRQHPIYGTGVLVILSAVLGAAAFVGAITLPIVFRCLYESRCTGTRGGALFFLDFFGLAVVFAEIIWHAARFHGRWRRARA